MFCPACGAQLARGLSFCNRCGASLLPPTKVVAPPAKLISLVWALSLATAIASVGGTLLIFVFVLELLKRDIDLAGRIIPVLIFSLSGVFLVSGLLIRQLSRVIGLYQRSSELTQAEKGVVRERLSLSSDELGKPELPLAEQTTRKLATLDKDREV